MSEDGRISPLALRTSMPSLRKSRRIVLSPWRRRRPTPIGPSCLLQQFGRTSESSAAYCNRQFFDAQPGLFARKFVQGIRGPTAPLVTLTRWLAAAAALTPRAAVNERGAGGERLTVLPGPREAPDGLLARPAAVTRLEASPLMTTRLVAILSDLVAIR